MRVMMDVPASQSFGSEGEFGWDGWLGSYVAMDPKENLAIIYVIQKCGGNGYRDIQVIRDIVYWHYNTISIPDHNLLKHINSLFSALILVKTESMN